MKFNSILVTVLVFLGGCGEPNLDDAETIDKILAEAIHADKIQQRGEVGENFFYAPNEQEPYTGWIKKMYDNVIITSSDIGHTGLANTVTPRQVLDTVTEFYILTNSNLIYSASNLPMGVTIDSNSGLISGSTTMTGPYNVTVTAQDAMDATYQVSTASLSFTVTEGGGAETVDFTTAETLPSANAGQNINETVVATGSQGSMPTYSFISASNTGNAFGLSGTTITVTGNQISGIAPRLLNAATYSFEFQASIQAGTITNNRTFTLLISQDATCVSPTDNICT